jgi:hypothetical protein
MNPTTQTDLTGTLNADGTLILDAKPQLPPGRVSVTLRAVPQESPKENWFDYVIRTRRELEASGHRFMDEEELAKHIEWLREPDWIDEMLAETPRQPEQETK